MDEKKNEKSGDVIKDGGFKLNNFNRGRANNRADATGKAVKDAQSDRNAAKPQKDPKNDDGN